jgi:hypothetical protein
MRQIWLGVLSSLSPLSLVDMLQANGAYQANGEGFGYLVVPFPSCGPHLLGCLLAWTLFLAPCFFFSPFLGCFPFLKFGKVSSIWLEVREESLF